MEIVVVVVAVIMIVGAWAGRRLDEINDSKTGTGEDVTGADDAIRMAIFFRAGSRL